MKIMTAAFGGLALVSALAGCAQKGEIAPVATPSPETAPAAQAPVSQDLSPTALAAPAGADAGATKHYVVRKGDSLWAIASMPGVLGDPMRWPLLYRSNRDAIADPDLISVDQELSYSSASIPADVARAMREAEETPLYVKHSQPRKTLPLTY